MHTYRHQSIALRGATSRIVTNPSQPFRWRGGCVETPHGFVSVYADDTVTLLEFIHAGRLHRRSWRKASFTDRGLVIRASRMAAAIVRGR
jgi:hypothetical protein